MTPLATAWTIAKRDLSPRFTGLRLLVVCLFLGVATLAAIGSLTTAIEEELATRGQTILGGDIEVQLSQREWTDEEEAALRAEGELSETLRLQAMARLPDGSDSQLIELKGVDAAYPLYGKLALDGAPDNRAPGVRDLYITPALGTRLGLDMGDKVSIGEADFTVAAIMADEPDRLSEGLALGPVALTSLEGLRATKLITPGSLFEAKYRIKLPPQSDPETLKEGLLERFPQSAMEIDTRENGAPGTQRFLSRMGQFLTLVGLAALVIAGIGVGNGVASYLRGKQGAIGVIKTLGADSGTIFRIYMLQILTVASVAIIAGLIVGALAPSLIISLAGDVLPVRPGFAVHPLPLIISALYGLLIAIVFALPPLSRARHVPAAGLFRPGNGRKEQWDRPTMLWVGGALLAVVLLAVFSSNEPIFSFWFVVAAAALLGLLSAFGWGLRTLASRLPRPRAPLLRLALTNLHRPGAQTGQLVVALGLGLTLFATLAAIQTSLNNNIRMTVPTEAPDYFVLDIPVEEQDRFADIVRERAPEAKINAVPTLRGAITAYGNIRVADLEEIPEGAWVLRGDRGLTYSEEVPEANEVVAGEWWPKDYDGPPLVSLDREVAEVLGLSVGDSMTFTVLGVELETRVGSLRQINWRNMGFNYALVLSPNSFEGVPHTVAATIELDDPDTARLTSAVPQAFPSSSIVEVKDVMGQVSTLMNQMATAIAIAASIAILSGIAVLVGAIAASRAARTYDSVMLKLLGATRTQILGVQAMEYALLALLLMSVAMLLGLGAGWFVITQVFEFEWLPDWRWVLAVLGGGALGTLALGLIGSIPVLSARPAQALRNL